MDKNDKIKDEIKSIILFLNGVDSGAYFEQMSYLNKLLDLSRDKKYDVFYEKINDSELWGGSGAIWESEFGMTLEQRNQFEKLLLSLLTSLEDNDQMGKKARRVFKLLIK